MAFARNPDLQRLLATLNGTLPTSANSQQSFGLDPNSQTNQSLTTGEPHSLQDSSQLPGLGFLQDQRANPVNLPTTRTVDPRVKVEVQQDRTLHIQRSLDRSQSNTPTRQAVPDSSTITTWPAALKHVTKHLVPNEQIASKIKHLITEQNKHEEQWWSRREAIVARHRDRASNQAKAADLLQSLDGFSIPVAKTDPKTDQAELEEYDKKVYKSAAQMVADFDGQLRKLGVPFYTIKHDLVILEEGEETFSAGKGRIDKGELRDLQRKMLQTLEDLFSEDD